MPDAGNSRSSAVTNVWIACEISLVRTQTLVIMGRLFERAHQVLARDHSQQLAIVLNNRKAAVLKTHHQLKNSCQWCCRPLAIEKLQTGLTLLRRQHHHDFRNGYLDRMARPARLWRCESSQAPSRPVRAALKHDERRSAA